MVLVLPIWVLWLILRSRFLRRVVWWFQVQHILESELEGLEEVRGPRPRRELGSTISCHLEGSEVPRAELCGLLPESKGQRPAGRCAPHGPGRGWSGRPGAPLPSRRRTGPWHVALRTSWRPASVAGRHVVTPTETWLVSDRTRRRLPIPAPSSSAARLGHGSGASTHLARSLAARPLRLAPACALISPPRTHAALPASPSLVLPVSLTPLDAELSIPPSQGPHGDGLSPRATPGSQCHVERRPRGPRSLLAAEISGARTCAVPSGDAPLHCALVLALLPSRLRRPGRRPEPLLCLLLNGLQWVW